MKTKFSEWMSRQLRSVTRRVWLGVVLCGALKLAAAVWIEAHWETVTGTGWIPVWVDGHYETEHVPGFWETQPVAGYWEDRWVEGHTENVWVDEYWEETWTEGYWEETWVDGYWEDQWNDGYWEEIWIDGFWDEEDNWHDGYWDWSWVDGYWSPNWVDGYSDWNWVDGSWESTLIEGHWDVQTVDGYWDQIWVPPTEETVWVEGHDIDVWVDEGWTLQWTDWSVEIWVEGHWEGEWTWTPHEVLGDWYWFAWSPDPGTVLEGVTFIQTRWGVRSRVAWETNEAGDVRNFVSLPDYTSETQESIGTKPFTWTPFDEPGAWSYSAWTPDPSAVPCGQTYTQERTASRQRRTGERNELGAERNVVITTENGQTPETRPATGTQGCGGGGSGGGGGGAVPVVSGGSSSATLGVAYAYQIAATGSPTSFDASPLPAGLSLNSITGVIGRNTHGEWHHSRHHDCEQLRWPGASGNARAHGEQWRWRGRWRHCGAGDNLLSNRQ